MKYLILLLIPFTADACEGFYAEFGGGWDRNDTDIIESPIGRVVLGYSAPYNWSVELDHISSLAETEDPGIETLWINKRVYFR